jgi:hypothetical protein
MTTAEVVLPSMVERMQKLETANRRWKFAIVFLLLILASSATTDLMSQGRGEPPLVRATSVESQSFRLIDSDGTVRGRLGMEGGVPTLELYDQAGKVVWSTSSKPRILPGR